MNCYFLNTRMLVERYHSEQGTDKGVTEELIIEYHEKGYSISRIAENIDVPIGKVMDVLSRLNEESDVDKTLDKIETSLLD